MRCSPLAPVIKQLRHFGEVALYLPGLCVVQKCHRRVVTRRRRYSLCVRPTHWKLQPRPLGVTGLRIQRANKIILRTLTLLEHLHQLRIFWINFSAASVAGS